MLNIPETEYAYLQTHLPTEFWSIFDNIFTSASCKTRKPGLHFYRKVLDATAIVPNHTVFIDSKVENVQAAKSFGFAGVVSKDKRHVIRTLRSLFDDPIARGEAFLLANAGRLLTTTNEGFEIQDNYAQLMILEATKNKLDATTLRLNMQC